MGETTSRHRSLLILCSVLCLVTGGLLGFFTPHPRAQPLSVVTPDPTPTASPLRVYVSGAVVAPAVYRLPPGSLVADAIQAAGGPSSSADLDLVNLAQELADQQQVHVPRGGEVSGLPAVSEGTDSAGSLLIDINSATALELEALPHIGPATSEEIVAYRETFGPFERIEEMMEVPGIGSAIFEEIRIYITLGP